MSNWPLPLIDPKRITNELTPPKKEEFLNHFLDPNVRAHTHFFWDNNNQWFLSVSKENKALPVHDQYNSLVVDILICCCLRPGPSPIAELFRQLELPCDNNDMVEWLSEAERALNEISDLNFLEISGTNVHLHQEAPFRQHYIGQKLSEFYGNATHTEHLTQENENLKKSLEEERKRTAEAERLLEEKDDLAQENEDLRERLAKNKQSLGKERERALAAETAQRAAEAEVEKLQAVLREKTEKIKGQLKALEEQTKGREEQLQEHQRVFDSRIRDLKEEQAKTRAELEQAKKTIGSPKQKRPQAKYPITLLVGIAVAILAGGLIGGVVAHRANPSFLDEFWHPEESSYSREMSLATPSDEELAAVIRSEFSEDWPVGLESEGEVTFTWTDHRAYEAGLRTIVDRGLAEVKNGRVYLKEDARDDELLDIAELRAMAMETLKERPRLFDNRSVATPYYSPTTWVMVRWVPPALERTKVETYQYRILMDGNEDPVVEWTEVPNPSSRCLTLKNLNLTGTVQGQRYSIEVRGVSANGEGGEPGTYSFVVTSVPAPGGTVVVELVGDRSFDAYQYKAFLYANNRLCGKAEIPLGGKYAFQDVPAGFVYVTLEGGRRFRLAEDEYNISPAGMTGKILEPGATIGIKALRKP